MDDVTNRSTETHSASVPCGATQAEEVRARWAWTEPTVWTARMLTTLEQGVKGGHWFSLIDKVYADDNLFRSFTKVAANGGAAGVDHVSIEEFTARLTKNLERLARHLRDDYVSPASGAAGPDP